MKNYGNFFVSLRVVISELRLTEKERKKEEEEEEEEKEEGQNGYFCEWITWLHETLEERRG